MFFAFSLRARILSAPNFKDAEKKNGRGDAGQKIDSYIRNILSRNISVSPCQHFSPCLFISKRIIFLFALLLVSTLNYSQNFRNSATITGKKDVSVNCILQSPNGELLIGTANGLVEYDGENFKLFTKENSGLVDDNITALFLDSENKLWIGHKNGKVTWLKAGKFSAFAHNDSLGEDQISCFVEAKGIWIGSYGSGIYRFSENKLQKFNSDKGLSDDFVYSIYNDGKNNLWIGTDAGMTQIDIADPAPKFAVMSMKNGLPDNIVRSISGDLNGDIWLAMQDSGLCRYDLKEKKFMRVNISVNWKYGAITSLEFDHFGGLYIGTKKNGVIKYMINAEGNELLTVLDANSGLLNNEVNQVFNDREKNLWVASAKGLSELSHGRVNFLTAKNGLLSDKIHALLLDSKGNYWISTDKGLTKYSYLPNGEIKLKNYFLTDGMLEKQITCIHEDASGKLWFGTYGQGVIVLDPTTDKQTMINVKKGILNDNISSITSDKNGNTWLATLGGGISKITSEPFSVKNYSSANGLKDDYVYCVYADTKNNLWIGIDGGGLEKYDLKRDNEVFENISAEAKLKGKTVYSVTEDDAGNMWFTASESGIYKYDGKIFKLFSAKEGLRDNDPTILATYANNIYTVNPKGIDRIDGTTGEISYFSLADNDIEPNLNASFCDREGNIWIGTNSGAIKFRSFEVSADTITPMVTISNLLVQYQPFPMDSTKDFSYRQNNFIFNFNAVWLRTSEKVLFRYKLMGVDSNYFETANKSASYSSLAPGSYTFLVSASNGEGKWSAPVSYMFTIATPIWQRWWFWILAVGISITGIYSFFQYRLRALQKEKHVLEEKVLERTREIAEKNKELERLSIVARETGNVIIIMDAKGKLEWVNYSFEKVNGITLENLVKLKGETIFEISNNPEIKNIIATCIREKRSMVYESKNLLNDGKILWESSTLTPIYDESGELKKLIIIDTDVTERKRDEEIIREKNKDITDSIEYAKKIQNSILPSLESINAALKKSFVLYMQKDIVSGDFYWFAQKDDQAIIAVVDCTGHGVPGAFMSLIGNNLLNQVINEKEITDPAQILEELSKGVIKALYKSNPNSTFNDGMDVAICNVNLKTKEIRFAGAMRPLYVFRGDEFEEIKGDKIPIGTTLSGGTIKYTTKTIKAEKNDVFYISSDGYADQFGGKQGKKMMTKNFKEVLKRIKGSPFEEQEKMLMKQHKDWKGEFEQVDDILVIGFSI